MLRVCSISIYFQSGAHTFRFSRVVVLLRFQIGVHSCCACLVAECGESEFWMEEWDEAWNWVWILRLRALRVVRSLVSCLLRFNSWDRVNAIPIPTHSQQTNTPCFKTCKIPLFAKNTLSWGGLVSRGVWLEWFTSNQAEEAVGIGWRARDVKWIRVQLPLNEFLQAPVIYSRLSLPTKFSSSYLLSVFG